MYALKLVLHLLNLFLNFLSLNKNLIKLKFQFLIIVSNMLISIFYIFRSSISPQFIQREIVICELSFQLANLIVKLFKSSLEFVIKLLLFSDLLGFCF